MIQQMQLTVETRNKLMRNGISMRGIGDDDENEFQMIKNRKNFTVAVRIKPEINTVSMNNLINVEVKRVTPESDQLKICLQSKKYDYNPYGQSNEKRFTFDKVYETQTQNDQIFSTLIQKKLCLLEKGVNLSIMAYGATNSGKTYTIFGKKQEESERVSVPGLSFLTLKRVFENYSNDFTLSFSFVQIYNESVYDLLSLTTVSVPLNVMQNSEGSTKIIGLNKVQIFSSQDLERLINQGNEARISCNNVHNMYSSRSHAFMELQLRHKTTRQRTKIVIVDLAGSEKYIYNAMNGGTLLKQGSNINKSLLSLGNCIKSLYENDQHIPYRDSKLTRLLKENLNGFAHNIMIACINKRANNFQENLNSLNYASKAIKIEKQIVRKIQSQEASEYQCTNCQQKLPYSLIKEINKHEDHKKRVKTRESHSLSISPISKNSADLFPFKFFGSTTKSNALKFQRMVEQSFENMKIKFTNNLSLDERWIRIIEEEKNMLKKQIREHILSTKKKHETKEKQEHQNKQILVSEFQSSASTSMDRSISENKLIKLTPIERKVKISLCKPKKKLQRTATTVVRKENFQNLDSTACAPRQESTKNHIKIEDDSIENPSQVQSSRSNLTVEILNDKDKILNERKQVLEQVYNNQKRRSVQLKDLVRFKSIQNCIKYRSISTTTYPKQSSDFQHKLKNYQQQNFIKIEDINNEVNPFQQFIINQKLLDSTTVAPRMRRDQDDMITWKNIVIKNVQSPTNIFFHHNHEQKTNDNLVQDDRMHVHLNVAFPKTVLPY